MKKFILFSLFIISFFINYGFSQQINWVAEDTLFDAGYHFGNTVSVDKNNNIYSGSIYLRDPNDPDLSTTPTGSFLSKRDKNGTLIWEKFFLLVNIVGLATDENGNTYISGTFYKSLDFGCGEMFDSTQRQMFLAKLDSNGNCIWSKETKKAFGAKCVLDKSGKAFYLIGGNGVYTNNYNPQFGCPSPANQGFHCVAKYDTAGNCLWLQPVITSGWERIIDLAVNEKYVAITGKFSFMAYFGMDSTAYSIGLPYDPLVDNTKRIDHVYTALYDLDGNLQWIKETADSSNDVNGNAIAIDDSNNVYVTGNFYDMVRLAGRGFHVLQYKDIFIVKYNEWGDTVYTTTWPGTTSEEARALFANKNGIYFSGRCYSQLTIGDTTLYPGIASIVLAKMSFDLKKTEWVKTFGSSGGGHSEIFKITSDKEDNIIVSGDYTRDLQGENFLLTYNNEYYKKPFVMSIKEMNPISSVKKNNDSLKINSSLIIYPNPTAGTFQINYYSPKTEQSQLNIFNSKGAVVYTETFQGDYNKAIDLGKKAKGVYLIEILAGENREERKIVLH